jgi:hypothetical protein
MNWEQFLDTYQAGSGDFFSEALLKQWGKAEWKPSQEDKKAAILLHTQIASRITTQRLGYLDGVEKAALDSIYGLFKATRDINDRFPEARLFAAVAWDVLNTYVRPFTAKWHAQSERGVLAALDATDEFRSQLGELQSVLKRFDHLLQKIHDDKTPVVIEESPNKRDKKIEKEMDAKVKYGIPINHGGIDASQAREINECERKAINARRSSYGVRKDAADAIGLALSGGGIRSATFSLGVLVALAQRGLLPQIDYLSTVSGGGYVGSFLSAFLNSAPNAQIGLRSAELPFRREDGEAQALRHIRHYCKYLSTGSIRQQAAMVSAQLYGMALNGAAIGLFVVVVVAVERLCRCWLPLGTLTALTTVAICILTVCALFSLLTLRIWRVWQSYGDWAIAVSLAFLLGILCIHGLEPAHHWYKDLLSSRLPNWDATKWLALVGAIPVFTSALAALFGRLLKHLTTVLIILSGVATPIFLFGLYLMLYDFAERGPITLRYLGPISSDYVLWSAIVVGGLGSLFLFDINSTSPHRHYRDRLAEAFLIQTHSTKNHDSNQSQTAQRGNSTNKDSKVQEPTYDAGVSVRLSDLRTGCLGPYHLINCALNVPGSQNIAMQGRMTDFFLFTPDFSGSPLTDYYPTAEWETADTHLDLGTAMAISGAAAAPQMGLGTMRTLSFWLALLNVRLGYWAKNPRHKLRAITGAPGLFCLLQEMLGIMDERSPWLNLTDGGHIENLGVYELLRRRCKYIIAVDGEEDSRMTFHGLTTLQRLAAIDLGVRIDINLDDLRLNDQRLSRSHFHFCRIRYPKEGRGSEDEFGYLLYVKLSLTGNEGEFLRRYRLDNPVFPHDPTANQFFTEAQFEAYRSLGEHIGDKLFLRAIVGDLADAKSVNLEQWFRHLGKNLLEPLPKPFGALE